MLADDRVLVGGSWRPSAQVGSFSKLGSLGQKLLGTYPVSSREEIAEALDAGIEASEYMLSSPPAEAATFLENYADAIAGAAESLADAAHVETALSVRPRLLEVELPRTVDQLRQAASAARSRTWTMPVLSPSRSVASYLAPIPGVVAVFGPNNFPFAFNSIAGGDFAAAIATRHPVIAVANPGHPNTSRMLAGLAHEALAAIALPSTTVQFVFGMQRADGLEIVADHRLAATAFTGSRRAGLALKRAADAAGRPIYLEMSSVNPVVILNGALKERSPHIAEELVGSALLGSGQFCTSPGIFFIPSGVLGDRFTDSFAARYVAALPTELLDDGVRKALEATEVVWQQAGAHVLMRSNTEAAWGRFPNTVLAISGEGFLAAPEPLQTEAFGNMCLVVTYDDYVQLESLLGSLEPGLTASVYSSESAVDDEPYSSIERILRGRVGRLLNDKPPTGVAVVDAMNHGGPYPSTGHPGYTAVGVPASFRRFGMLQCFDGVRPERLPPELQPHNPLGLQRYVDGIWTTGSVEWPLAALASG